MHSRVILYNIALYLHIIFLFTRALWVYSFFPSRLGSTNMPTMHFKHSLFIEWDLMHLSIKQNQYKWYQYQHLQCCVQEWSHHADPNPSTVFSLSLSIRARSSLDRRGGQSCKGQNLCYLGIFYKEIGRLPFESPRAQVWAEWIRHYGQAGPAGMEVAWVARGRVKTKCS